MCLYIRTITYHKDVDLQVQREKINVQPLLVADGDKTNSPEKRTLVQSTGVRLWLRDDCMVLCIHTHTHTHICYM